MVSARVHSGTGYISGGAGGRRRYVESQYSRKLGRDEGED